LNIGIVASYSGCQRGLVVVVLSDRPTNALGKITIEALAPDATCDGGMFLPGNVVDGIAGPSNDPVFAARSPAYAVSFGRRQAQ